MISKKEKNQREIANRKRPWKPAGSQSMNRLAASDRKAQKHQPARPIPRCPFPAAYSHAPRSSHVSLRFQEQIQGPKNAPIARFDGLCRYQNRSEKSRSKTGGRHGQIAFAALSCRACKRCAGAGAALRGAIVCVAAQTASAALPFLPCRRAFPSPFSGLCGPFS